MNARKVNTDLIEASPHYSLDEIADEESVGNIHPDYLKLDIDFRAWHGRSTLITSFYRHGDDGAHGQGKASDKVLFKTFGKDPCGPKEMYHRACAWPFLGVGLYFDWAFYNNHNGRTEPVSGIHTDTATDRTRPLRWVAASFLNGQPVTPLLLTESEKKKAKRVFFYQDWVDGLFKAKGVSRYYSLDEFISIHYQRS